MPTIITRSDKGAALTHAEMDQNLVKLNEGIGAVEADALLKLQVIPEADFMAQAADRRAQYAGSGFVEDGKWLNQSGYTPINDALYANPTLIANTFFMGCDTTNEAGHSKTKHPIVNFDGFTLHIAYVNSSNSALLNKLLLPPAPSIADMPERQDLVLIEAWHEKITDKDFVYPLGNVQYGASSDSSTGLAIVNGSFTGYGTYSLFGNWQNSGDLIGKGLVWSTLSEANKKKFVSEPKNNVYLAADGTWVQVRYRIRVIQGLGASWFNVKNTSQHLMYGSFADYVIPKGAKTSITADLGATSGGNGLFVKRTQDGLFLKPDIGAWVATPDFIHASDSFGYQGLCFALPIALVSRRNQGAYHPVFNSNGAARLRSDTDNELTSRDFYAPDVYPVSSSDDCFTHATSVSTHIGNISGGSTGRPDNNFYDAIYESDVLDLRNSAHKSLDLNRCIEREFNKLVAGEMRGWEEVPDHELFIQDTTVQAKSETYFRLSGDFSAISGVSSWNYLGFLKGTLINKTKGTVHKMADMFYNGTAYSSFRFADLYDIGNYGLIMDVDDEVTCVFLLQKGNTKAKTLLQCDIIGDPAYYPQEWKDNGIAGTPLLVGENGEDYIPDGTMKNIKLSRKCSEIVAVIRSNDGGQTWGDVAGTIQSVFNSTTNTVEGWTLPNGGYLVLFFYLTEASPFKTADNAEVLSVGNVFSSTRGNVNDCGLWPISHLIDKIPTGVVGVRRCEAPLTEIGLDNSTLELASGDAHGYLTHPQLNLTGQDSPAAKVLPYLTRENGKLFLQCLFKEMAYDGTWGDDSKFDVVDGVSTTTDDNGNTVLIGQKRAELQYFIGDGE